MIRRPKHSTGWIPRPRIRHVGSVTLATVGVVLGTATVAAAYFSLTGIGTGAARAGSIGAPTNFEAISTSPNQATLSWSAPTNPAPTGYTLAQTPGTLAGTCATLTKNSVSCLATGLTQGTTYNWHLTADDHSWTSAIATATTTTTRSPTITLTPTTGSGGTSVKVIGSGFAPSSSLTFAFLSPAKTTTNLTPAGCTPTTTAAGALPSVPCEVATPAGAAIGGDTVEVTDATGNRASATFAVTASVGRGTMSVLPTTIVNGSSGNTLTYTYEAASGALTDGAVDLNVASWVAAGGTAPQIQNPSAAGYTLASTGTLAYTATHEVLEVTGLTLPDNGTFTLAYGSGGGTSGVMAPTPSATSVPYTFGTSEASTALETPAPLANSPLITVIPP